MHKGLLRLTIITAFFAFGASTNALAAPLCSSLFETLSTAPGDLSGLLSELAELKMDIDLAASQGTLENSPVLKTMETGYKIKLERLRQSGLSASDIKDALTERIRKLQNQKRQSHAEVIKNRDEQIKALGIFLQKSSVKLQPVATFRDFDYIPELKKLSIYAGDGPRLYSIEDGKMEFTLIGNTKGFKVLPDLKHGLAIKPLEDAVHLYEMGKREPVNTFPTAMKFTDGAGIEFSPSGQQALLTDYHGQAHLLNFASKKFTTILMPGKLSYSYAKRRGYFINETVILITSETTIARIDTTSGKFIERDIFENQQQEAVLSEDRKTLLVYSSQKLIALNAETLEPVSEVVAFSAQGKSLEEVIQVPGTDRIWIRLKDSVTHEQFFATDIEIPQFEFQSPFSLPNDTAQIRLSSDGSEVFVLRKDEQNIFYIEHWKR